MNMRIKDAPSGRVLPTVKGDPLELTTSLIRCLRKFEPQIVEALGYGNHSHTFNDVCSRVLTGKLDLYELPNAAIIMEYSQYPEFAVYHGFIAVGDLQEILDYHPQMNHEAKIRQTKYLSIAGRRGWERAMAKHGWKHKLSIMEKEVDYG